MESIEPDVKKMLMEGEEVLFVAKQGRIVPGGSLFTPDSIYVTNRRVIWRNPKLLGLQKDYNDFDYRDISNIRINKGIFSTEISLKSRFLSDQVTLPAVDKNDASQIGAYIQKGMRGELPNQLVTERKTESKVEIVKTAGSEDPMEQLKKLGELKATGVITEEQFQKKREEMLKRI